MDANIALQYIGQHGWGVQGRMLGISRMFQNNDISFLKKSAMVASFRPRGILSGFLAVIPSTKTIWYLPPVGGKIQAKQIRMRLTHELLRDGAILSCYWNGTDLVLEDALMWRGVNVWQTMTFQQRWDSVMKEFSANWQPDVSLQGCIIRFTEYMSLEQIQKPENRDVIEFIPNTTNSKRLIWVPTEESEEKSFEIYTVRREAIVGPDIFSVWSNAMERLGIAYIRTLAMSRQLRLYPQNEFKVKTQWNKMFERHEIVGILSEK
jgi:hypothetical protein